MGEAIGMSIEIGGELPANLVEDLLSCLEDEVSDITGSPTDPDELRAALGKPKWYGISNYGECDDLKAFCVEHGLSYIHHCESKYEYNASISYWTPGMKNEVCLQSNQDEAIQVDTGTVRPLLDLLVSLIQDKNSLPLFVGNPSLVDVIEPALKNPDNLVQLLREKVDEIAPILPELPALIIKETE